ncbi:hypothetical protein I3760_05G246300 [Carya illinoinensis]|nr:hypothetical protein I3760_05G246300 [Carya illinoinensis]
MRILSWNSRGLANAGGVRVLRDLIHREVPNLVFVMETKLLTYKLEQLKYGFGFYSCLSVNCEGHSEGLGLFWICDIDLELVSYSKHHFDAWVNDAVSRIKWRITAVYGHLEITKRYEVWNLLKQISAFIQGPWFCFRDFNKILVQ